MADDRKTWTGAASDIEFSQRLPDPIALRHVKVPGYDLFLTFTPNHPVKALKYAKVFIPADGPEPTTRADLMTAFGQMLDVMEVQ